MSVSFDQAAVIGATTGEIDSFDYVDGRPGLIRHLRSERVPRGAPMIVSGWALAPGTKSGPRHVCVVLDGAAQLPAATGFARDDIAAQQNSDPEVGYRVVVPTDDLVPGPHEVRTYVRGLEGGWYEAGFRPFFVYDAVLAGSPGIRRPLRMSIERALDAWPLEPFEHVKAIPHGHPVLVTGWAFDPLHAAAPQGIVAFDEQNRSWSAPIDVMRPNLRPHLGARDDRLGFELMIPSDVLGRGRHTLRLSAYGEGGRIFESGMSVTVDIAAPLRRFPFTAREIDRPPSFSATFTQTQGGRTLRAGKLGGEKTIEAVRGVTFGVEGWALDARGHGAADVFVEIAYPGFAVSPHRHVALAGFHRDSVPKLQNVPPVPDGWFFCPFGTRELRPGLYIFDLVVVAPGRQSIARASLGTLAVHRHNGAETGVEETLSDNNIGRW